MNRSLIFLLCLLLASLGSTQSWAQHEFSSFTATGRAGVSTTMLTDYQSVGVNPANLAFQGRFKEKPSH